MDRFFSERTLHESGSVEAAIERLDGVYEHEGALWLRTTAHGDDKDRVLRRSNGEWTYFASDIAYHLDKLSRGYDRAIAVWGPDHHGHIHRMRIAWEALGRRPGRLRDRDHAARQPHRERRAGEDVEAGRRDRHARRPARRDRRGRGPLVPGIAEPRHDAGDRPRPGAQPVAGQPGLLRAVRARAHRLDPAQGGGGACGAGAGGRPAGERGELPPLGTRAREAPAGAARRDPRGGRAPRSPPDRRLRDRDRAGLLGLLPRLPRGGRRRGGRRRGRAARDKPCSRSACWRSRSTCSGSRRRRRCS